MAGQRKRKEVCGMQTEILYEDKEILVVFKPAGIAVQTAHIGQQDVVSELKNYLSTGKPPYLGIIHRLDQPVEGVLVFAKTPKAASVLSAMLQKENFCKTYLAAVCGKPGQKEGTLVDYLLKVQGAAVAADVQNKKATNEAAHAQDRKATNQAAHAQGNAKKAVLHYEVLKESQAGDKTLSLLRVRIETGRFHQIRAQLSHAGTPVLGDAKYGGEEAAAFAREKGVRNVALCAESLRFKHPVTGKKMEYTVRPKNPAFAFFDV